MWRGCLVHWKLECGERFFSVLEVGVLRGCLEIWKLDCGVWIGCLVDWNVELGVWRGFGVLEVGMWGLGC